jgi:hypothetical protein
MLEAVAAPRFCTDGIRETVVVFTVRAPEVVLGAAILDVLWIRIIPGTPRITASEQSERRIVFPGV